MYPKKANITCKSQFSLQNYLSFIMKVPLFPEIKVYSNHKPQLFPEDAGVEVGEPLSEGFCLFPGLLFLAGAVSVLILVMLSGAENQAEQGVWERERHGITEDISRNGSKVCPSFPDLPVSWLLLLPHQGSLLRPCRTGSHRLPPAPTGSRPNTLIASTSASSVP